MSGGYLDDPNREAVGLEPAWAEGFGGSDTSGGSGPTTEAERLDAMTKAELLGEAEARGLEADSSMTKADIRAVLETSEEAV